MLPGEEGFEAIVAFEGSGVGPLPKPQRAAELRHWSVPRSYQVPPYLSRSCCMLIDDAYLLGNKDIVVMFLLSSS